MKQFSFFLLLNVLGCTVFGQNMRILSMNHSDFTAKDNADGNGKFVVLSQYAQDNSHSAVISTFIKNDFSLAHSFELTHQNMGNEMAIALENANISAKKNPTPKNNYYILSHTQSGSFGSTDMVLTRLNENGKILWSKTIGSNGSDWGKIVVGTGNGALIGGQVSNGSTQQFYCFVDSAGVLKWSTLLNHSGSNGKIHPLGNSYYIGGNITENGFGKDDMMVAKLDKNGKPTWAKIIGSAAGEGCHRITGGNGNLYFGGVQTDGKKSVSVVKCDTTGKIIWKKKYGANQNNESMQVLSLINDTLYVLGKTTSFGAGGADLLALKIDQNGKLINHNAIGGTGQEFLTRSSITTLNNNIVSTWHSKSFTNYSNTLVFELDANLGNGCPKKMGNITESALNVKDKNLNIKYSQGFLKSKSIDCQTSTFTINNNELKCGNTVNVQHPFASNNNIKISRNSNSLNIKSNHKVKIEAFSILGQELFKTSTFAKSHELNISGLQADILIIKTINQNGEIAIEKVGL